VQPGVVEPVGRESGEFDVVDVAPRSLLVTDGVLD
jgi:hypothetical protein